MFGGVSSRKFSRLDDEDIVDQEPSPQDAATPSPLRVHHNSNDKSSTEEKKSPHSPLRGRKMLRSVACITGSPKRIELQDEEDDYGPPYNEPAKPKSHKNDNTDNISEESFTQQEPPASVDESSVDDESDASSSALIDPPLIARTTSQTSEEESQASLRQQQLDEAIQEVIHSEFAATSQPQQHDNEESSARGLPVQPTYDEEYTVFRPSSEADTDVSQRSNIQQDIIRQYQKRNANPATPVTLDENDGDEVSRDDPHALSQQNHQGSSSVPTGESYDNIKSLIARVQRLDAVVQAGEEQEAARSTIDDASRSPEKDADDVAEMKMPQSPPELNSKESPSAKPLVSPTHDSPIRQHRVMASQSPPESDSNESPHMQSLVSSPHIPQPAPTSNANESPLTKPLSERDRPIEKMDEKEEEDGSQHFQVIYRRGRDSSPVNSHTKTSLATSSIVTMSSFGIPGVPTVQKHVPVVTPPVQTRRLTRQVTSHPFFWRTHPRDTFTSYGPNRPKTMLTPIQGGKMNPVLNMPRSRRKITPHLSNSSRYSPMRRVEEVVDQKYDTRYRERERATSWPTEPDSILNRPWDHDGDVEFSPYGDDHGTDRPSVKGIPLLSPASASSDRPSTISDSWVAFSEFSVESTEQFQ